MRILIVDDNKDLADSLAMYFGMMGHDARAVYSGKSALESAPTFAPHAVIIDLLMPQMDGFEVARQLRQRAETVEAVLIAISGLDTEIAKAKKLGFNFAFFKPAPLDDLHGAILEASPPGSNNPAL